MKRFAFAALTLAFSLDASATTHVARHQGVLWITTYEKAKDYCRKREQRLPTIRELGTYSQLQGASPFSETEKQGYYLVQGADRDGKPESFYFSHEGYRRPKGPSGRTFFWSSSPTSIDNYRYTLYGINGALAYYADNNDGAVMCLDLE
jgi:hypothetical protein